MGAPRRVRLRTATSLPLSWRPRGNNPPVMVTIGSRLPTPPAIRYRFMHGYERPLPELPALIHINEAHCLPGALLPLHIHPTLEICFTLRGRCQWLLPDRQLPGAPGEVFVT